MKANICEHIQFSTVKNRVINSSEKNVKLLDKYRSYYKTTQKNFQINR